MGNNYNQKQAITILKLAVMCTNISTRVRPSMAQIVSVLRGEKTLDKIDKEIPNASSASKKYEGAAESSTSPNVLGSRVGHVLETESCVESSLFG